MNREAAAGGVRGVARMHEPDRRHRRTFGRVARHGRATRCRCGKASRSTRSIEFGAATPLTLVLGTALIVLPVLVLVLSVPAWEQRTVDAQDAARAAARALATATDVQSGEALANQAVAAVMAGDGLPSGQFEASYSGELVPGASVTATVSVEIPIGEIPGLGAIGNLRYSANSTAHVDSYADSTTGGASGL